MTTDHSSILAHYEAFLATCLLVAGMILLCAAPQAVAAATSHVAGAALTFRPNTILSTATARPERDRLQRHRDAILLRGLISSPLAMPPLCPRATRRYAATPVASLSDNRRPQIAVRLERPRVHLKRPVAVTPAFARQVDRDARAAKLRDAFASVAARRGPPSASSRAA